MIGDFLYRLTPRDEQVTPLDVLFETRNATAVAVSVSANIEQSALARFLALKTLVVFAEPGAGASIERLQVILQDRILGFTVSELAHQRIAPGVALEINLSYNDLLIPPGYNILATASFNVAAAGNSVNLSIGGILIPRGNLSLGDV